MNKRLNRRARFSIFRRWFHEARQNRNCHARAARRPARRMSDRWQLGRVGHDIEQRQQRRILMPYLPAALAAFKSALGNDAVLADDIASYLDPFAPGDA